MEGDLKLADALERIIRRWYVVAMAGIIGGVVGLLYSLAQPPVFDAFAVLTVALNFDLTQPLTQYEEDLAQGKVAGVVSADAIWEQALRDVGIEGELSSEDREVRGPVLNHWIARKGTRWEFSVSSHDPAMAARVANAWASRGDARLAETQGHAFEAMGLQVRLDQLLSELAALEGDPSAGAERIEHLEQVIIQLQSRIQYELDEAQGVATFVSYDFTHEAVGPGAPASRGRGQIVLAGTALGVLSGIALVVVGLPKRAEEPTV